MFEKYNMHIIHALEKITERISKIENQSKEYCKDVSDITSDIEKAKKELYNSCSDGK